MYAVKKVTRPTRFTFFSITAIAKIKLLAIGLLVASVPLALYVRVDSKNTKTSLPSLSSKAEVTVQAAGRGKAYFNFRDGQAAPLNYRGDQSGAAALQSGQARARSLASIDLNRDAAPDLVVGYSYGGRVGLCALPPGL